MVKRQGLSGRIRMGPVLRTLLACALLCCVGPASLVVSSAGVRWRWHEAAVVRSADASS